MNRIIKSDYDEFVVLGRCCEPAFIIQYLNLSSVKYPFNWALIQSIDGLCEVLMDDFKQYNNIHNDTNEYYGDQIMKHVDNTQIYYPHSNIIFDKKIENFRILMKTTKRVLFILKSHEYLNVTPIQAEKLVNVINHISSTISYNILIVNEYSNEDTNIMTGYNNKCIVYNIFGDIISDGKARWVVDCNVRVNPNIVELWKKIIICDNNLG